MSQQAPPSSSAFKRRRVAAGKTIRQVAEAFCVHPNTIARWERGAPIDELLAARVAAWLDGQLEVVEWAGEEALVPAAELEQYKPSRLPKPPAEAPGVRARSLTDADLEAMAVVMGGAFRAAVAPLVSRDGANDAAEPRTQEKVDALLTRESDRRRMSAMVAQELQRLGRHPAPIGPGARPISVKLGAEEYEAFQRFAKLHGVAMAEVVRACARYIRTELPQGPAAQ